LAKKKIKKYWGLQKSSSLTKKIHGEGTEAVRGAGKSETGGGLVDGSRRPGGGPTNILHYSRRGNRAEELLEAMGHSVLHRTSFWGPRRKRKKEG